MGSYFDFKTFGDTPPPDGGGGGGAKEISNFPLTRQSSIYSLTFDELQNTLSGVGKDYGSMNMEDLLKNIWTAEESQAMMMTSASGGLAGANIPAGDLHRQGSITLPRTVSQKTVDEVWRDFLKETTGAGVSTGAPVDFPRQATLGEMTLEEFLLRAGVVREDHIQGVYSNIAQPSSNGSGLSIGFQQPGPGPGTIPGRVMNMAGIMPPQASLFPKQTNMAFSSSPGLRNNGPAILAGSSPGKHDVIIGKCNVETSSSSPYAVSETGRGRRSGGSLEKVVERRRRRMIKNRESAARSRARKQAYTLELEAEVDTLKQINQKLQKKNAELIEMQKNQIMEPVKKHPWGEKRRCLRRTMTGPW